MPRQVQDRVLELVESALGTALAREVSPDWLKRPGLTECGDLWPLVQSIYGDLTGGVLPEIMPPRERRRIDAVLTGPDGVRRIVEVDESQHFTPPRARTLALYPAITETAFDRDEWARRASAASRLPGGGFARPCPPLFPEQGGRHQQRAFRDALADLLPSVHGWAPTLRIGDFEVTAWMHGTSAQERMADLLATKGLGLT